MKVVPNTKSKRLRRSKPGDLGQLRRVLWRVLLEVEQIASSKSDNTEKLRAAHALATLAGSYVKVLEMSSLETRLDALEAVLEGQSLKVVM